MLRSNILAGYLCSLTAKTCQEYFYPDTQTKEDGIMRNKISVVR